MKQRAVHRNRGVDVLPKDPVELKKLECIVDTAWEMAQVEVKQLREIKRLIVAGKDSEALAAMARFFHLKPNQGVCRAKGKLAVIA